MNQRRTFIWNPQILFYLRKSKVQEPLQSDIVYLLNFRSNQTLSKIVWIIQLSFKLYGFESAAFNFYFTRNLYIDTDIQTEELFET